MSSKRQEISIAFALCMIVFLSWLVAGKVDHLQDQLRDARVTAQVYHDEAVLQNQMYVSTLSKLRQAESTLKTVRQQPPKVVYKPTPTPSRASRSRSLTMAPTHVSGALHDITQYCDTGSRTASGKWPEPGMVATARRDIPFGTRVSIDGLGIYTVEDRIGHGSEFDLFTHSCSQAREFGRKHRAVTILGE